MIDTLYYLNLNATWEKMKPIPTGLSASGWII